MSEAGRDTHRTDPAQAVIGSADKKRSTAGGSRGVEVVRRGEASKSEEEEEEKEEEEVERSWRQGEDGEFIGVDGLAGLGLGEAWHGSHMGRINLQQQQQQE